MCKVSSKSDRVTWGTYKKFVKLTQNDPKMQVPCGRVRSKTKLLQALYLPGTDIFTGILLDDTIAFPRRNINYLPEID